MNAIQQISLKIQLGIDPETPMEPEDLRMLWEQQGKSRFSPHSTTHQPVLPRRNTSKRPDHRLSI